MAIGNNIPDHPRHSWLRWNLILFVALGLGCGCLPVDASDGVRIGNNTVSPSASSAPQISQAPLTAKQIMGGIKIINDSPSTKNSDIRQTLLEGLTFLLNDFGQPAQPLPKVIVHVTRNLRNHASVRWKAAGPRTLYTDPFNFYQTERHFIVHELFHAFYQSNAALDHAQDIVEGWATYAQLRFRFSGKDNSVILGKIADIAGMSLQDLRDIHFSGGPWGTLPAAERLIAYMQSALPYLMRPHEENREIILQAQSMN